jgi:holin-like protein
MNAKLGRQMGIIFGIYWLSQVIEGLLPFSFPASVIALILILVLLLTRVLKPEHIRETGDFLQAGIAFFLIPVMVGLVNYVEVIAQNAVAFFVICFVSTVLTFAAVAWTVQLTCRWMEKRGEKK